MKIEGLDFIDWLHKIRMESEKERRRRGISGEEWLKKTAMEAEKILGHKIRRIGEGKKTLSRA